MNETIESSKGLGGITRDIQQLQTEITHLKERQMDSLNASIRIQEKSSDAYVLAKEAATIAKSTQRELEATSKNIKTEVETMTSSLEEKLEIIRRATTNPLGK